MSNNIYEIITKATICKGFKKSINKYEFKVDCIDKVLGCWITNHHYQALISDGIPIIQGSYDIHLWYCVNCDSELLKETVNYQEVMDLVKKDNRSITINDELYPTCKNNPKCILVKLNNNVINIEIEKEMSLKIVGEATILVESKEEIIDNNDTDLKINPNFIT